MSFTLHSKKSTYESNERNLFGELFIEIEGCSFPCDEWADIISGALGMWLYNLNILLKNDLHGEGIFYFMDGSFFFKAACNGINNEIEIRLFDNDMLINKTPYKITFAEFISVILKLVEELTVNKQSAKVDGIKRLKKDYLQFKQVMEKKNYNIPIS